MSSVPLWAAIPAAILLVLGGLLALVGSLGLLRLPDFLSRMHAPTMGTTLGAGCVLIASMLVSSALASRPVVHELIITVFIVITAPVTAMLLVKAALYRREQHKRDDAALLTSAPESRAKTPGSDDE